MTETLKKNSENSINSEDLMEFLSLQEKATKEALESHTKAYYLNKKNYSKNPKVLNANQIDVLIKLRNSGVSSKVVANSLKIQVSALTQMIKNFGYRWSISLKKYVLKDQIPKAVKKQLKEKTNLNGLRVDASVYRIVALRAYLEDRSYAQVVADAILASTTKDLKDLANKPNRALKFEQLIAHKNFKKQ